MKFLSVSHAISYYWRLKNALTCARGLPLEPRESDSGRQTDLFEKRLLRMLTVGVHFRGLLHREIVVLGALYGEEASFSTARERLREAYRARYVGHLNYPGARVPMRYDFAFLDRVRREAERKVGRSLERRGLLGA